MAGLDLALSEQQTLLRDAVARLTVDVETPDWAMLTDQLGLGGLTLPEDQGGFGGGATEIALVMADLGPALAGADWLSHAAACAALGEGADLATGQQRAALVSRSTAASLPDLRDGNRIEGTARLVAGAAAADLFVVALAAGLLVVPRAAAGLSIEPGQLHDGSAVADLHFAGVMGTPLKGDPAIADGLVRIGRCAEAVGLMQRMLADTAGYLGQRRQFGAPIASFQALRHRLADMQLIALQAQALTEVAVISAAASDIAAACIAVRDAARQVGEGAVQLHGAMGLTEELRLGARFKRLLVIASGLGSEAGLLSEFAAVA
mgnify:CR=1 FL=1